MSLFLENIHKIFRDKYFETYSEMYQMMMMMMMVIISREKQSECGKLSQNGESG